MSQSQLRFPVRTAPASARGGVGEWAIAGLVAVNLAWTTLCLGGYLAETMSLGIGLSAAALALCLGIQYYDTSAARRPLHPAGLWLLPFLAYALANALWITPMRWDGLHDWLKWAQLIATFWTVLNGVRSRGPRWLLLGTLAALGVVGTLLACYQRFVAPDWMMLGRQQVDTFIGRAGGPFGVPNSFAGFLILLIPPALGLALRREASATQRVLGGWLVLVWLFALFLTISRGGWLALIVALAAWPLLAGRGTWARRGALALGILAVAGGVIAWLGVSSPRVADRLAHAWHYTGEKMRPSLWSAAVKIFQADPAWGGGAGSYDYRFEPHRPLGEVTQPLWAHSEYLNTLSDYGAVGAVLFFGAGAAIAWRTLRSGAMRAGRAAGESGEGRSLEANLVERRGLLGSSRVGQGLACGLGAFALHMVVDFHLKIPALALAVATVSGIWVALLWQIAAAPESSAAGAVATSRTWNWRRVLVLSSALLVAAGTLWVAIPHYRAEGVRENARRPLDRLGAGKADPSTAAVLAERAYAELSRAVSIDPGNAQAWADRAYALAVLGREQLGRERELGRAAEADARRALALGPIASEYWLRLGVALDMQRRWLEAGDAFSEALRLAPNNAQSWYYQAYHLSLDPTAKALARAAIATCLRLDPAYRPAEGLRRQLAAGR